MHKFQTIDDLKAITEIILDENSSHLALEVALNHFIAIVSDISQVEPNLSFDAWSDDAFLTNGVAINPSAAAQCVKDYQRTVMFIRGVYSAILDLKDKISDRPLKILYAGCGPYATLLLLLLNKLTTQDAEFIFLDYHQESIDSVARLLGELDFKNYDITLIKADATLYKPEERQDLILTETMQKSLEQEPQFAITANLANYLAETGVFIPQSIDIELVLTNQHGIKPNTLVRHSFGRVFQLSPANVGAHLDSATLNQEFSQMAINLQLILIPAIENSDDFEILMLTEINVYENQWLYQDDSELTLPYTFTDKSTITPGQHFQLCYVLGSYPKFYLEDCSL